ncbi:1-acyl-sn-glycerol-3-phosphate acyltransferase [Mariniphaga anaerophila]|uniref:1-acyl-sn-glycerol-3-phosphate acyltransferase n=1 Tax=Mariniphaga anaerophila TaxID=1484053 RepID=A0A1M5DM11_9BACT|nr:lysophospholipid acyltransferase family protein [Mariniphaga anaerophila]SHF67935.1 1-acyl-sn-glycerol-3-phosphate acyltransferase [Mariniphaga anaerophila]
MKTVQAILLFPLALFRLLFVAAASFYVVLVGSVWLMLFGFSRKLQNWSMRTWGRSILFVCGVKIKRNDIPDTDNFILMPNHRGYLDIFIVAANTPAAFVAKAELKKWPFLKGGGRISHTIFVSRSELRSAIATMGKIKASVSKGIPVALFPEGTSFKGPLTRPFKKGSFKIAADTGIPVIPMAIHFKDEDDAWVGNDTFIGHFFRQMGKPVTFVTIRYGTPLVNNDYKTLQQETREQIDGMLTEIISGIN